MPTDRAQRPAYDPITTYPPVASEVGRGWDDAVATLPGQDCVVAIDGPSVMDWDALGAGLSAALSRAGRAVSLRTTAEAMHPFDEIVARTSSERLGDDPHFEMLPEITLGDLFRTRPEPPPDDQDSGAGRLRVILGPGAALAEHDLLWYADLPKRYAERAVASGQGANLGQRPTDGPPTTRRLLYVDWPLLDRHRDAIAERVARWLDTSEPADTAGPTHLDGDAVRATIRNLVRRPFRTRAYFNTTSWGGHWAQRTLGVQTEAPNTALGYELIAPESGVLIGAPDRYVEIPLQTLVSRHPVDVLGSRVHRAFGTSFPVRFDYLDTEGGGNLSVHTHPQPDYMTRVFGWPYTQHESYYLMSTSPGSKVYLGLRADADLGDFEKRAHEADDHGVRFDIEQYVQTFPAERHQLYLVPGGTPHGSGEGNVVLEISATPYLYSLRFYDWLRADGHGNRRPVHVEHAFSNLDTRRTGDAVGADLVQRPRRIRDGDGWSEELLGRLPDMFFEVRRLVLDGSAVATVDTGDGFDVLNVVEGSGVRVDTADSTGHDLCYAETVVVPASVGRYTIRSIDDEPVRVVRCVIREDL